MSSSIKILYDTITSKKRTGDVLSSLTAIIGGEHRISSFNGLIDLVNSEFQKRSGDQYFCPSNYGCSYFCSNGLGATCTSNCQTNYNEFYPWAYGSGYLYGASNSCTGHSKPTQPSTYTLATLTSYIGALKPFNSLSVNTECYCNNRTTCTCQPYSYCTCKENCHCENRSYGASCRCANNNDLCETNNTTYTSCTCNGRCVCNAVSTWG